MGEKPVMDCAPRKIALLGEAQIKEQFKVRKFQIDSNQHMNNVVYVKLAMEVLPEDIDIRELRVDYKKPALLGEEVVAAVCKAEDKYQVVLQNPAGDIYAVVEFTLSER